MTVREDDRSRRSERGGRGGRGRVRRTLRSVMLAGSLLCLGAAGGVQARVSSNEQVSLAGEGRYDELALKLEESARNEPLRTPDRHSLCYAYSKLKRYDDLFKCLDELAKAALGRNRRSWLFGMDDVTPAIRLMRSEAHVDLGQYEEARTEAATALEWFETEGTRGERDILIEALGLAGIAAALDGDRDAAVAYRQRLESVPAGGLTSSGLAGTKAMALARLNLALGEYRAAHTALTSDNSIAIESFLERLVHGRILDSPNWVWQELPRAFLVNRSLLGLGQYAEAKRGYDELLALPQTRLNGGVSWLVYLDRGIIAEQEGDREKAIDYYRLSIEVIESQRSTINTEAAKIGFSGNRQEPYNRIIDLLCSAGRLEECFEYMERAKSRALVDLLATRRLSDLPRLGDPRWEAIRPLIVRTEELDRQIQVQSPVRRGTPSARKSLLAEKKAAEEALRRQAPEIAAILAASSVGMKDLRPLVSPSESLIQYFIVGPKIFGMVVNDGSVTAAELGIDGARLRKLVEATRTAIENKAPDAVERAAELYGWLIRPHDAHLTQRPNLLIIPHGVLHSAPFAALFDGKQFLVDRYGIRMLPSASVLTQLRQRTGQAPGALLAVGDPQGDLPAAQEEARRLAGAIEGSQLLLGGQATVDAFTASASKHRLIHLAAHAEFNSVQLAPSGSGPGTLTADDVYRMTLGAELVTLSACSSGLGKTLIGDELLGLPREFLVAGASSVISSLWDVEDQATASLMLNLYMSLGKKNKRDALREAQRAIKQTRPHPFYWGAFYLTGKLD